MHAYVWLKAHPVTEALSADLLPLKEEWKVVFLQEIQLNEALTEADARVLLADSDLDSIFNAVVNALLTLVNNDRRARLARHKKILAGLKQKQEDSRKAREEAERATFEAEKQELEAEMAANMARIAALEARLAGKGSDP